MRLECGFPQWLVALFFAAALGANAPAAQPKIYIVTDLEGASGVYKFAQTREPGNPSGEQAMEYLMGDITAVVRGLKAAGAAEILIPIPGFERQSWRQKVKICPKTTLIGPLKRAPVNWKGLITKKAFMKVMVPGGLPCWWNP